MKRALIVLALIMAASLLLAQDKTTTITVRSTETASGVIIINAVQPGTADQTKASFELHCNKGFPNCAVPEPGTYTMVRLPKNWGLYDGCANVDLYAGGVDPASGQKVGQYCVIEK